MAGEEKQDEMLPELEFKKALYKAFVNMCFLSSAYTQSKMAGFTAKREFEDWQNAIVNFYRLLFPIKTSESNRKLLVIIMTDCLGSNKELSAKQANFCHEQLSLVARERGLTKLELDRYSVKDNMFKNQDKWKDYGAASW